MNYIWVACIDMLKWTQKRLWDLYTTQRVTKEYWDWIYTYMHITTIKVKKNQKLNWVRREYMGVYEGKKEKVEML